jgi:hypothetical protein
VGERPNSFSYRTSRFSGYDCCTVFGLFRVRFLVWSTAVLSPSKEQQFLHPFTITLDIRRDIIHVSEKASSDKLELETKSLQLTCSVSVRPRSFHHKSRKLSQHNRTNFKTEMKTAVFWVDAPCILVECHFQDTNPAPASSLFPLSQLLCYLVHTPLNFLPCIFPVLIIFPIFFPFPSFYPSDRPPPSLLLSSLISLCPVISPLVPKGP